MKIICYTIFKDTKLVTKVTQPDFKCHIWAYNYTLNLRKNIDESNTIKMPLPSILLLYFWVSSYKSTTSSNILYSQKHNSIFPGALMNKCLNIINYFNNIS